MGQSSTLYRIGKDDFNKIIENPKDFGLSKIKMGYEIFDKTFAGLEFVLQKGLSALNKELIELIFNPNTFCGEEIDYSTIDFEKLPDDFDFESQPIYYIEPSKVSEIHNLLDTISIDVFQNNFDHEELNREGIYPNNVWNNETRENVAFNVRYMTVEFVNLKTIFKIAKENNEYLLSYVG